MMMACHFIVAVELLFFLALALPFQVLSAQLAGTKDLFCRNEQVQIKCTVQSGVLEWRLNPQSLSIMSGSFLRNIHPINRELTISWPGLSIQLRYVADNSTHMESTASFTAAPEFHGMAITCAGQTETLMVLMVASGDLHAVNSVYLSVHKTSSNSNLTLVWDEPSLIGRPSVDYYLVAVNKMELNVTSPRVEIAFVYSELNITIRYYNCMELSPTARFYLFEDQGEQPNYSTTQYLVPTDTRSQSTRATTIESKLVTSTRTQNAAIDELPLHGSVSYPIFISAILGTFIATTVGILLIFVLILKLKQRNKSDAAIMLKVKAQDPVYEDISISKDLLHLHANNAYNF